MGVMEVLHDLREFCSFVGTGGHVAGYPDEVRRAAHHWKRRGDAIDALLHDLETSLAAGVQAGPGGNWNDDGQRAFRSFFDDVRAGLREQATHSHEMAKTLDDAAGQMDSFNSVLEAIVIEIGIWIAATALVSWIPGVDVAEEGVAVARGTSLLARGVSILRRVALFLREIALVFGRAPRAARAVRMFERARALEEGAAAARAVRGGRLLAGLRDWRAGRLLERSASIFDARKELRAERALALYRASWVGRLRIAAYTAKGDRLLDRAVGAVDAGRIARSERLFAQADRAARLAWDLPRSSLVNRAWTAYRLNSISGFALRMVDKGALDPSHDPTKGWQRFDPNQLLVGNVFFTAVGLPVGGLVTALADGAAGGLARLLAGPIERSPAAGFWLDGALKRVPGVLMAGMSAVAGPAMNATWASINLPLFLDEHGAKRRDGVHTAFTSALDVSMPLAFPAHAAAAIAMPGWSGGQALVLPAVWTAMTAQELGSPRIRAARGIVVQSAIAGMPGPGAFAAPHPGAFPVASLPVHVVAPGDTLWDIARAQYGSGLFFPDVAGRNHLANPDLIHPGQRFTLPPVHRGPRLWTPPPRGSG